MTNTAIDITQSIQPEIKHNKKSKYTKVFLTSDNITDILHNYVRGDSVNSIVKAYGCSYSKINNIIIQNKSRIEQIRNQRLIEQEKTFKFKLSDIKHNIADNITQKDINEASLSQKTGSLADLQKVQALVDGTATDNISLNVINSQRDDLINYIKNGIIDEKH